MYCGMECCSAVPVTMGSPRFRRRDLGAVRVTDACFAARDVLQRHSHERTIVGFMVAGGFDLSFSRRTFDCVAGSVFVEPAGERHGNRLGADGARVLVLEIDPDLSRGDLARFEEFLSAPSLARRADLTPGMRQLLQAVGSADSAAVEANAWELLGRAAAPWPRARPEGWAERIRELLHDNLHRPMKLVDLARETGVHRVHLGRVFRDRFGESLGDYHRRIRLDWAAGQLQRDEATIGEIALRAGFTDQAHFTRFFKRHAGVTPGAFREGYQRSRRGERDTAR